MRTVHWLSFLSVLILLGLGGCATPGGGEGPEAGGAQAAGVGQGAAQGIGAGEAIPLPEEKALTLDALNDPQSPLAKRIIYFEYDSDTVRPEFLDVIATHGQFLAKYPQQHVRLEGHTDERGSREYNLALGERRARAVKELLKLQGVSDNQIEVVSFGEELPAAFGHDEASWRLNRRVELVYPE